MVFLKNRVKGGERPDTGGCALPCLGMPRVRRTGSRRVTPCVAHLIKMAFRHLKRELEPEDKEFVTTELARVDAEFTNILNNKVAPWLSKWIRSKKTTRIWASTQPQCISDAVMIDLSAAYKKRLLTMGESQSRCESLRALFKDPHTWFLTRIQQLESTQKKNAMMKRVIQVFGDANMPGAGQLIKEFYTRFYGLTGREKGILNSIGELAKRQNTLFVVQQEIKMRAGRQKHGLLMIQTDSLTFCKSGVEDHPLLGKEAWMKSASSLPWEDWIALELSEPGIADWKVDARPIHAIFPGVVNKYAFMHAPTVAGDSELVEWDNIETPLLDVRPRSMLNEELANARNFSSDKATKLLREALENGSKSFEGILAQIPHTIRYKDSKGNITNKKPSLRILLEPFAQTKAMEVHRLSSQSSASVLRASESTFRLTPFERAIHEAKSKPEYHFVVGKEFDSGARKFEVVRDRTLLQSGCYHEYFTGTVRPFAEYDPDKENPQPLPDNVIPDACASLTAFFMEKLHIEVCVEARVMMRDDKLFACHVVFFVAHKETMNEVLFWDPHDIKEALGVTASHFDEKPWRHRKCLRLPGCKKPNGEGEYKPINGDDLSNPDVYEKYCVCVAPTADSILYGTRPVVERASASLHSNLFFPSEKKICTALIKLVKIILGSDYKVTVDKCQLCNKSLEANCVWQRVKVVCGNQNSKNFNKLLDLRNFCEKVLHPWSQGKKATVKVCKLTHHRSNNSYVLWKFSPVEDGMLLMAGFRCFHKEGNANIFKDASVRKSQIVFTQGVVERMLARVEMNIDEYEQLLKTEQSETYKLPLLSATTPMSCTVHSARKAIRNRLRAQRRYRYLGSVSRKQQTKQEQEKVRALRSTRTTWDSRFSFSIAVALATLNAPDELAARVSQKEFTYALREKPGYHESADDFLTKMANARKSRTYAPRKKLDKTILAWLHAVY